MDGECDAVECARILNENDILCDNTKETHTHTSPFHSLALTSSLFTLYISLCPSLKAAVAVISPVHLSMCMIVSLYGLL